MSCIACAVSGIYMKNLFYQTNSSGSTRSRLYYKDSVGAETLTQDSDTPWWSGTTGSGVVVQDTQNFPAFSNTHTLNSTQAWLCSYSGPTDSWKTLTSNNYYWCWATPTEDTNKKIQIDNKSLYL